MKSLFPLALFLPFIVAAENFHVVPSMPYTPKFLMAVLDRDIENLKETGNSAIYPYQTYSGKDISKMYYTNALAYKHNLIGKKVFVFGEVMKIEEIDGAPVIQLQGTNDINGPLLIFSKSEEKRLSSLKLPAGMSFFCERPGNYFNMLPAFISCHFSDDVFSKTRVSLKKLIETGIPTKKALIDDGIRALAWGVHYGNHVMNNDGCIILATTPGCFDKYNESVISERKLLTEFYWDVQKNNAVSKTKEWPYKPYYMLSGIQ